MHSTKYLYNIEVSDLQGMEYFKALEHKKKCGEKLVAELLPIEYESEANRERMFYVEKALKHTNRLLEEKSA